MSYRVYLSGSMANRVAEQVKAERELAVTKFAEAGIFAVDPAAAEQKLWGKRRDFKIGLTFPPKVMKAFVERDKWLIRRCDALLVMTGDSASDGTWREMTYAEKLGIPVIMISQQRCAKKIMGWSNIEVQYIVPDLETAVRLIKRKFLKQYEIHRRFFDTAIRKGEYNVIMKKAKKNAKKQLKKAIDKSRKKRYNRGKRKK